MTAVFIGATINNMKEIKVPLGMIPDIRTNHAGETGAVTIYRSILRFCGDEGVKSFARRHLESEEKHLAGFRSLLEPGSRSRLLFAWRFSGAVTVGLMSLFGPKAVYAAVAAVEDGVDRHFQAQLDKLSGRAEYGALEEMLKSFQADERAHRDEAAALRGRESFWTKAAGRMIGAGSAFAVAVTRRL